MIPSRRAGSRAAHALVATVLAGLLTYFILALVSRTVSDAEFDQFSVFWSLALIIGFGFFLAPEQEAARMGRSDAAESDVLAALMRSAAVLTVALAAVAVTAVPILIGGLGLPASLAWACVLIVPASAVQFTARARMLVQARSGAFANLLITDTVARVVFFAAVAAGVTADVLSPADTWYAAALLLAIVVAHAVAVPWRSWSLRDAPTQAAFRNGMLTLLIVNLIAQTLVNVGPILIQALSVEPGAAGDFQASATLTRIPLAAITPIQAMLVVPLAAAALSGDRRGVARTMGRVAVAAAVLAAVGGVAAWTVGPAVVDLIFGPGRALPPADLTVLTVGVIVHVALIVFTQALVASGVHRVSLIAWVAALITAVVSFLCLWAEMGAVSAVAVAFGAGSLLGAGVAYVGLVVSPRRSLTEGAPSP